MDKNLKNYILVYVSENVPISREQLESVASVVEKNILEKCFAHAPLSHVYSGTDSECGNVVKEEPK